MQHFLVHGEPHCEIQASKPEQQNMLLSNISEIPTEFLLFWYRGVDSYIGILVSPITEILIWGRRIWTDISSGHSSKYVDRDNGIRLYDIGRHDRSRETNKEQNVWDFKGPGEICSSNRGFCYRDLGRSVIRVFDGMFDDYCESRSA